MGALGAGSSSDGNATIRWAPQSRAPQSKAPERLPTTLQLGRSPKVLRLAASRMACRLTQREPALQHRQH